MLNTQKQPLSLLSGDLSDDLNSLESKIDNNLNPFANYLNNDTKNNPFHESNPFHSKNPFRLDENNTEDDADSACSSLKVSLTCSFCFCCMFRFFKFPFLQF